MKTGATNARMAVILTVGMLRAAGLAFAAPICPGGRFLVSEDQLIAGEAASQQDVVVVAPPYVSIASGCGPASGKFNATRKGSSVRAAWQECREPGRRVVLKARIDPACATMRGTLTRRGAKS